jgi:hypothetical protein
MKNKWSLKQSLLAMMVFFAIHISVTSRASANTIITFSDGTMFRVEGPCDGWFPDPPAYPRCTPGQAINKTTDSLIYNTATGQGWLISGGIKMPILSDRWHTFLVTMKAKYPTARMNPEVRQTIANEFAAFSQSKDSIAISVSMARMKIISQETGLPILPKTPIVVTPALDPLNKTQE